MIKENEIRIGNYFFNTVELKVIAFSIDAWYCIIECVDSLSDYEPIPLTEEMLIKLGFEKNKDRFVNECIVVKEVKDGFGVYLPLGFRIKRLTSVKYTHQLQNLYFALSGKELTFKN